ncbi:MAG: cbb3-type cytochrome c oxidase subunit 3 [Rhizobiaceae bacterium]|nr:cbb3-type cytochrome c oxidase subunit 3 [Rhizobiaceae bacterium]
MDYNLFRELADSWGLVYLFALFVGVIFFTFRPGSRKKADEIAKIPFKEDQSNG